MRTFLDRLGIFLAVVVGRRRLGWLRTAMGQGFLGERAQRGPNDRHRKSQPSRINEIGLRLLVCDQLIQSLILIQCMQSHLPLKFHRENFVSEMRKPIFPKKIG